MLRPNRCGNSPRCSGAHRGFPPGRKSVIALMDGTRGGGDVRRADICLYLGPADRAKLEAIVADRNSPRKLCWRAEIVLGTADGLGTNAIMRRTGKSKPCV